MNKFRAEMPVLARCEGVWEGVGRHYDGTGKLLDQYRTRTICRVLDDLDAPWLQTNLSFWDDGRTRRIDYHGTYRDGRLWFDNEWVLGWLREVTDDPRQTALLIYWQWKAPDAWLGRPARDLHMYHWMQVSLDGQRRSSVVHWLDDGVLQIRSNFDETRRSDDWRAYDAATTADR